MSKTWVIMTATAKESLRQPAFLLILAITLVFNLVNSFVPFFTFGDDIKMYKECGLATILFGSLILSVYLASSTIADEVEGKTAMTLLSKPVNRQQFILGKYLGITVALIAYFVPATIEFVVCLYAKVGYDARESSVSAEIVTAAYRTANVIDIFPALVLSFMEAAVVTAISVAISTRLPMVANLSISLALFVIGHLTQSFVFGALQRFEIVMFMANLFATIVPSYEFFNVSASIAQGVPAPWSYVGTASIYCLSLIGISLLIALILFEDRDLA